jgi:UDP-N-acetylmuramoylalanine-D-glutamate ligase
MAIPSKQIGQSAEANLLWQISKQLEHLIKVTGSVGKTTTTTTTAAPII